jgi:nitrite reductase/ring-hydroxylating ferredoxin subunit
MVASLVFRRRGDRGLGRALSSLGALISMGSAYLGGHLVYARQIGVDHAANAELPEEFLAVLPEHELDEGSPRKVEADGTPIVLVRHGGRIHALFETCSHQGGPLSEGKIENGGIVCPWHGSRFALEDGSVLDGPAAFRQPCLETRVRNGQIEVRKQTAHHPANVTPIAA